MYREARNNIKKAILFVVLTLVMIALLFFIGIPVLGKFTAFVSDLGKSSKPITSQDTTPPAPPRFNQFPDFTSQKNITISGNSESAANIEIVFNGAKKSLLADKNGDFSFNFDLIDGDNVFSATATDPTGNISQKSKDAKIIFDNKPPDLNIDSPSNNSSFFGSKQKQVTIQGTSEVDSRITINDRIISIDDNGKFQYTTTLNDGENKFIIKSTDRAGNATENDLTINFTS